jgi:hypothetical protein
MAIIIFLFKPGDLEDSVRPFGPKTPSLMADRKTSIPFDNREKSGTSSFDGTNRSSPQGNRN